MTKNILCLITGFIGGLFFVEWLRSLDPDEVRFRIPDGVLAPAEQITDPDRAEQLGLTVEARRMRRERELNG